MTKLDHTNLPDHLTKGGPGDEYLGDGKIDTSEWFKTPELDKQIQDQEIWFCAAPFQMIYTNVLGQFNPCSWAQEKYKGPNVNNISMIDYFKHDEELNKMRKEMTTPGSDLKTCEKVCKDCLFQERNYGRSRRQASLKIQTNDVDLWPGIRKAVDHFKKHNVGEIGKRIFEIQIKAFGNKCNFDCYMCMPHDSTQRGATLNHKATVKQNVFNDAALMRSDQIASINIDDDAMIKQIVKLAPYIYNLKLIGGEPLVMKNYYKLLQAIVDSGHSKDIILKYQTNMSVLTHGKYTFLDYVDKFELFEITVSLDGIGKANDYIRRRGDWEQIKENIKTLYKYPNVKLNVNGAISFLSVLRFHELIKWFDDNNHMFTQINWSNIRYPLKLRASVLPEKIKQDLIPKYKGFPDIQNLLKEETTVGYKDAIDYLLMVDKRYKGTKWEMNLFDVFPELKEYYVAPEDRLL